MKQNRRTFLQTIGAGVVGAALTTVGNATEGSNSKEGSRRFHYFKSTYSHTVFLVWTAPAAAVAPALERIAKHARRIVFLSAPIQR